MLFKAVKLNYESEHSMLLKKFTAYFLSLLLLCTTSLYAQGMNKCAFMLTKQERIKEMKAALASMKELQIERTKAREIRDLLVDSVDAREIALLAESLDEEATALQAEGRFNRNMTIAGGLGSVILAGLLFKRMKASAEGATVMAKLVTALKTANKAAIGKILTSAFIVSVTSTFWFGGRMSEISDQREFLISLVIKLNALKDLADTIVALEEEIEQEEISFSLRLEELRSEGLVDYNQGELVCL